VADLTSLIISLATGILLGYFLRNKKRINLSKVVLGAIIVLIFSLGFGIGSNDELLNSMPRVGLNALVISVLAILFSVLFVGLVRRKVGMK